MKRFRIVFERAEYHQGVVDFIAENEGAARDSFMAAANGGTLAGHPGVYIQPNCHTDFTVWEVWEVKEIPQ